MSLDRVDISQLLRDADSCSASRLLFKENIFDQTSADLNQQTKRNTVELT